MKRAGVLLLAAAPVVLAARVYGFTPTGHDDARPAPTPDSPALDFGPAVRRAGLDGLGALGQFVYYDAMVFHGPGRDGFDGLRARAMREADTPTEGGSEKAYLSVFRRCPARGHEGETAGRRHGPADVPGRRKPRPPDPAGVEGCTARRTSCPRTGALGRHLTHLSRSTPSAGLPCGVYASRAGVSPLSGQSSHIHQQTPAHHVRPTKESSNAR